MLNYKFCTSNNLKNCTVVPYPSYEATSSVMKKNGLIRELVFYYLSASIIWSLVGVVL